MTEPRLIRSIPRIPADVLDQFRPFSSADLHEASGQVGAMHSSIKPVVSGLRLMGSALTVQGPASDDLTPHIAIHLAEPNDVLVVNVGGDTEAGVWGGIMSMSAHQRGAAGLVMDGAVRDVDEIRASGFPVYAKAVCIKGTGKDKIGWINHPIVCGGVSIRPGDLVVGDDDGVVVVGRERLDEVLAACQKRMERERWMIEQIQAGRSTYEFMNLEALVRERGYSPEDLA